MSRFLLSEFRRWVGARVFLGEVITRLDIPLNPHPFSHIPPLTYIPTRSFAEIIPQSLCTRHGLYLGAKMAKPTQGLIYALVSIGFVSSLPARPSLYLHLFLLLRPIYNFSKLTAITGNNSLASRQTPRVGSRSSSWDYIPTSWYVPFPLSPFPSSNHPTRTKRTNRNALIPLLAWR